MALSAARTAASLAKYFAFDAATPNGSPRSMRSAARHTSIRAASNSTRDIGDHVLDQLERRQRTVELAALDRVVDGGLQAAHDDADAAGADRNPTLVERVHGDRKALALFT